MEDDEQPVVLMAAAPKARAKSKAKAKAAPEAAAVRGLTAQKFYSEVAKEAELTAQQARALLRAAQIVVCRELKAGCRQIGVPGLCRVRVKARAARPQGEKLFFGRSVAIPARAATTCLKATPAKTLKDSYNA
jgi:nucleoid DNA-binding protein